MAQTDIRDAFFDGVYEKAAVDPAVVFLTADMDAFSLAKYRKDMPDRFFNVGISEQALMDIATGLALQGKTVFAYGIAAFVTLRCFEQVKVGPSGMNLPVTIVGSGGGITYGSDGPTHHAVQDMAVMRTLPHVSLYNPSDPVSARAAAYLSYTGPGPAYVRLDKGAIPDLYDATATDFGAGVFPLRPGRDVAIVATGVMVHTALAVATKLEAMSVSAGVVDVFRLKPLDGDRLCHALGGAKRIVTMEEHTVIGGLGSLVAEQVAWRGLNVPLLSLALKDEYGGETGSREWLLARESLDPDGAARRIREWIR